MEWCIHRIHQALCPGKAAQTQRQQIRQSWQYSSNATKIMCSRSCRTVIHHLQELVCYWWNTSQLENYYDHTYIPEKRSLDRSCKLPTYIAHVSSLQSYGVDNQRPSSWLYRQKQHFIQSPARFCKAQIMPVKHTGNPGNMDRRARQRIQSGGEFSFTAHHIMIPQYITLIWHLILPMSEWVRGFALGEFRFESVVQNSRWSLWVRIP